MTQLLLAGLLLALSSTTVHAVDETVTDDTPDATNVISDSPEVQEVTRTIRSRVTYYTISGLMFSGETTRPGAAACSTDLPLYTHLRFPDSREVWCLDRGILGSGKPMSWVDIYATSLAWGRLNVAQAYGSEAIVEVLSK